MLLVFFNLRHSVPPYPKDTFVYRGNSSGMQQIFLNTCSQGPASLEIINNNKFPDFSSAGTEKLLLLTKELGAFAFFRMKICNSELLFCHDIFLKKDFFIHSTAGPLWQNNSYLLFQRAKEQMR